VLRKFGNYCTIQLCIPGNRLSLEQNSYKFMR
jgi:hypothetical protein